MEKLLLFLVSVILLGTILCGICNGNGHSIKVDIGFISFDEAGYHFSKNPMSWVDGFLQTATFDYPFLKENFLLVCIRLFLIGFVITFLVVIILRIAEVMPKLWPFS